MAIYKINLLSNQDIYIKNSIDLYSSRKISTFGRGLTPLLVLDLSPRALFSKRKMTLQGS